MDCATRAPAHNPVMPTDYSIHARVEELIDAADRLPYGPEQVALGSDAVRLADTANDVELAFYAREQLIAYANFGGQPELALVTFSWCLGWCDKEPDRFAESELFWQYKWMVGALPAFPTISRQQIASTLDDFEMRFRRNGNTMRPVWLVRRRIAGRLGDAADEERYHRLWMDAPRDENDDCRACEIDQIGEYQLDRGDLVAGMKTLQPVLSGRYRCGGVPHTTYAITLMPLVRGGDLKRAAAHHAQGIEMVMRDTVRFLYAIGDHVRFLALTGRLAEGMKLIERSLRTLCLANRPSYRLMWLLGARLLLDRVCRVDGKSPRIRVPREFQPEDERKTRTPAQLLEWADQEADTLAAAFDARNGNSMWSTRLADTRGTLHELADSISRKADRTQ